MKRLYLFYDEECEVCRRLKDWLSGQAASIELQMVVAGSAAERELFPNLRAVAGQTDLVVVSDAGEVYLNNHAWIMCLYALEEYRDWALRLASPVLRPLARQAWEMLSRNRAVVSRWMRTSERDMAEELRSIKLRQCGPGSCDSVTSAPPPCPPPGQIGTAGNETVRDYLQ
ncbi:MAG: DCC1-like thiol-disulfide oxidoreductase family protein [Terriglobales bacterium]